MGTCLSKKKASSSSSSSQVAVTKSVTVSTSPVQASAEVKNSCNNGVTETNPKVETDSELNLKEEHEKMKLQEKQNPVTEDDNQVKKEILIVKHRKSHDDRDKNSKSPISQQNMAQQFDENVSNSSNEVAELMNKKIVPESVTFNLGVRTSSCSKEEVDAILIQCGRLSRSASRKATSSSATSGERGRRKYSGSKRSYDFDHCDNDTNSADDDQRRANAIENNDPCEDDEKRRQHRQRQRQSPKKPSSSSQGRRRTPSRERDQNQRSSSRERRVSRSPGRRSSDTNNTTNPGSAIAGNGNNNGGSRPGKMVSVPATVSSMAMDKSNNGGEWAASTGVKRISVKRNVGGDNGMAGSRSTASPVRSRSPARGNGGKVFNDNNQQPSLSRNSSRKAEQSPYRRNPLNEIDPNSLAYPQSANNNGSKVQNRTKKEIETEANQKPNVDLNDNIKNKTNSKTTMEKGVSGNVKTREPQEEEAKILSSMTENVVVKTVVPPGVDNLKPQTLTRSRSSRRSSRDLDLNPEALLNPGQSYTSLLLEDIQNFHQKNTTPSSVSLPACVTKACSILEAVADLNSTTSSNLSAAQFSEYQSLRSEFNTNTQYGKKVIPDSKEPFVESEVVVNDDVMEPSLHKYVTVRRGGSSLGEDMEDQESSGSNSFTVSSQQQNYGNSSSSWEPNSADSKDCWTSRLNSKEENHNQKSKLNGKRRECDHLHSSGIGRGRLGNANKGIQALPVVRAAASA